MSNIAWDVANDEEVAGLLGRYGIDAIDVAPGKYFPDPAAAADDEIAAVKNWWATRGVEITGMQSLLFGTSGLNVFGTPEAQNAMLAHLSQVCRIAQGLGATRLVFGSPKNRDRSGLSDAQALDVALPFFSRLGDIAANYGVLICLEPNPTRYGANFMTTSPETAKVVAGVAHPAIRMQFDTGALTINGEEATDVLADCAPLIGHVHASEPGLLPLGDGGTDHGAMQRALARYLPDHIVSIEMVAATQEVPLLAIERALKVAVRSYRDSVL